MLLLLTRYVAAGYASAIEERAIFLRDATVTLARYMRHDFR